MGTIIDGNLIAQRIINEVKGELTELKQKFNKVPKLCSVVVGQNPAIEVYVKSQKRVCDEVGMNYDVVRLPQDSTENDVLNLIENLNKDENVNGIILQLPLPQGINHRKIQQRVSFLKDVEGVTPQNLGMLFYSEMKPIVAPCTALAVIECLKSTGVPLKGKETVIVGHSEIVGKPIALMLLSSLFESPTPTICHIATRDLKSHTLNAEILIVAVGKAHLITADMVKEGAIVIDVGINRIELKNEKGEPIIDEKTGKPKTKIVGDVDFENVLPKVSYITPVPGGVGAVTTAMLLKNTIEIFKLQL